MNPLPDRMKQRRDYVKKWRWANVRRILGGILYFPAVVAFMLSGLGVVMTFFWELAEFRSEDILGEALVLLLGEALVLPLSILIISGVTVWACLRTIERAEHKMDTLPYIPPMTAASLPAEEVLVRAAGEPTAPAEILLRAATGRPETQAPELLRATQNE